MKKTLILLSAMLMAATMVNAQDDNAPAGQWTTTSTPALKASEFFFDNWSSSGNSQIDVTGTFFGNYKYTHPKFVWDNVADLAYGYAWQDLDDSDTSAFFETRRKSNDKIDLTSALSWNAYKGWGASFTANLKTQFGNGYEYSGFGAESERTKQLVSGFFSPAYLTTALSFEHKRDNWSVSLSFLTGKTTFVTNDSLILNGLTYGVLQDDGFDPADPATYDKMRHAHFALGSYVKAQYLKKDLLPSLDLYARVELFYDYQKSKNMSWDDLSKTKYTGVEMESDERMANFAANHQKWYQRRAFETDVDFELKLDYRFSSHIAANLAVNLKYDTDFAGFGRGGHWQLYQMAGVQIFFNWKTPKS